MSQIRARTERAGLVVLILAVVATHAYRYGFPISTSGPIGTWRRTQTAWGIRSMMRGSLNPFSAEVPVLGPPWKLPFEFPLYQWVSAILGRVTGVTDIVAGRVVATIGVAATGVLTYFLGKHLITPVVGAVAAVLITLSPYGIHWGAEISIEYFTVALCIGAFVLGHRWLVAGTRSLLVGYLLVGFVASLSKTTSLIPWIVGLVAFEIAARRRAGIRSIAPRLFGLVIPLASGLLWTRWADSVKSDNPHAAPFVTSEMWAHNFGRISDRAEMATWQFLFRNVFDTTVGGAVVAAGLIVVAVSRLEGRRQVAILGTVALTGPAVFASLYWAHPYYAVAVMPALVLLFATGLVTLVQRLFAGSSPRVHVCALAGSLAGILLLAATSAEGVELMNATLLRNRGAVVTYEDIEEFTTSSDPLLVVSSAGWDPTLSFVADRRMLMLFPASDPNSTRPLESELGTTYKFAYWMGDAPEPAQWSDYLPPSVTLEPLSSNLFRILASSVG